MPWWYNDDRKGKVVASKTIADALRRALRADKRPLLQIVKAAGLPYPPIWRFREGQRKGIRLDTAEKLAAVLGLELRPVRKRKDR